MAKEDDKKIVEQPKKAAKAVYPMADFVANAANFGATPDIVIAAFYLTGIKEATKEEGQKIIKEFSKKEVK